MSNIVAMIPARIGSQRLKYKNLAIIQNKPLIYYSIRAAKEAKIFDKIILNSDNDIFKKIADRYKINFYRRPKSLGSSKTKTDEVVIDFINKFPSTKILVWVNPIAPLQTSYDIVECFNFFIKSNADSLITTTEHAVHGTISNKPINFKINTPFDRTQDLKKIELFFYSLMIWKCSKFTKSYVKKKSGVMCGNFQTYPVPKNKSIIIKNLEDLKLANFLLKISGKKTNNFKLKYDNALKLKL
tara:strand:- start:4307 stop:5032 length:726 start_codon:yes stop_codon:yes gene_type:complete